jgi:hypothetical protein
MSTFGLLQSKSLRILLPSQDLKTVNIAMHEVRTGNKLRRIIEVVLVLGNYMNRAYGVYSQAQGFSVESLVKVGSRLSRRET